MKKTALLLLAVLFLAGCTARTEYGDCVGVADEKDPALVYKLDIWNTVVGIVFVETIVVPMVVLANQTFCPVDKKEAK